MKALIFLGGIYCLAFALFHLAFWHLFDWKNELPKLNAINRGVMQVLNLRLTYVFFIVAFLCFFFADELLTTILGNFILGAISLFALMRGAEQLIFWKAERIGVSFFIIFMIGAVIFAFPLFL